MLTDRERLRLKTFYSTKALVQEIWQGSGGPTHPSLFLGQSEDRKSHHNHFSRMGPSLILECGSMTNPTFYWKIGIHHCTGKYC